MDDRWVQFFNDRRFLFAGLEKEKNEAIRKIEREYKIKKREVVLEQLRILTARTLPFKYNIGLGIISSLVSKIEGEKYVWKEMPVVVCKPIKERVMSINDTNGVSVLNLYPERVEDKISKIEEKSYTIIYLVQEEKEKIARNEIANKFLSYNENNFYSIEEKFGEVSDNYLELAHYETDLEEFYENIDFYLTDDYEEHYSEFSQIRNEMNRVLKTKITNPKFAYISLFLDYVLEYNIDKVWKSTDKKMRTLTFEELQLFVNDFVHEYKKNQEKIFLKK